MQRNIELDLLKILSCIAVVILHVAGIIATRNSEYTVNSAIYYTAGFAVPIFFMVNGNLLLNKSNINYKYIIKKILNILFVIFLWNVLIFLAKLIIKKEKINPFYASLNNLIQREYFWQFWFFGSLIVIYLMLPVIYKYWHDLKIAVVITGSLISISVFIDLISLIRSFSGESIIQINTIQTFRLWTWFSYYLIGGLLGKKKFKDYILKHVSRIANFYIFIVMTLIVNIYQYGVGHYLYNTPYAEYFYDNIFTFIWNISLFVLFYRNESLKYRDNKIVKLISDNTMGIYIVHVTVIKIITHFYKFNTPINNICLIFIVFVCSLIISLVISKLPIVNRLVKI